MSTAATSPGAGPARRPVPPALALGVLGFLALFVVLVAWAKWVPYWDRAHVIGDTDAYPGSSIFATAGEAGDGPSLAGAWSFTKAYVEAIWQALLAGFLLAAAVEALLPRRWLVRVLSGRGSSGTVRAGLASLPSMMCSCCTAPIAATLRRCGVSTEATLAYWLGNPLLNPAVLVFLALLLPWPWVATRVVVGGLLVVVATAAVARLARDPVGPAELAPDPDALRDPALAEAPGRFVRSLWRSVRRLVPELLVLVFAIGLLRGWLFPLDGSAADWGVLGLLVAAVVGTLVVIPTGGEVPIVLALAAAGVGPLVLGALLVTLPALSLPSVAMVGRTLSWRVVLATAGAVALGGVVAGLGLDVLGG